MSNPEADRILELMTQAELLPTGKFQPYVIYDEHLDSIRVLTADCSVTEVSVTDILVVLERNHMEEGDAMPSYAGFHIDGARWFCKENGLPISGIVKVSDILQKLSSVDPTTSRVIRDVALPTLREHDINEVEFPTT
jgi:hypothetical protein